MVLFPRIASTKILKKSWESRISRLVTEDFNIVKLQSIRYIIRVFKVILPYNIHVPIYQPEEKLLVIFHLLAPQGLAWRL